MRADTSRKLGPRPSGIFHRRRLFRLSFYNDGFRSKIGRTVEILLTILGIGAFGLVWLNAMIVPGAAPFGANAVILHHQTAFTYRVLAATPWVLLSFFVVLAVALVLQGNVGERIVHITKL